MEGTGPTPHRRVFATPRGTAELDVAGTERQAFVTVTLFDQDGWAADEEVWWSGQDQGLAEHVARLTGMAPSEAQAVASDFLSTWRQRGGPAEGAAMTHRFSGALLGGLLAVGGAAALVTWAVGRRSPTSG